MLLYVLPLEPLLRKLSSIPRELSCGESVSVNVNDIIFIVTEIESLKTVGEAIKNYETVAGAKIKARPL